MTPTARTLAYLRKHGWLPWVVEKTIPGTHIKTDLFNVIDVLAIRGEQTLGVQATSGSNVSARVKKIQDSEHIGRIREAGWLIHVHGWRKNAKGRWELREVDLS